MPVVLKDGRIDLELPSGVKEAIETAAMISGQSLADFMVVATAERAREVIREADTIVLSARDFDRVIAALDDAVGPSDALKRAAERHGKRLGLEPLAD